ANVVSYATMRSFASCNREKSGQDPPQVNIFVSPDVMASAANQDGMAMCSPGVGAVAYHGWGISVPNFTVEPTTSAGGCSAASQVMHSMSHEMVELLSDPAGFGWLHVSDVGHVDLAKQLAEGELGDICQSKGLYTTPDTPFPNTPELTNVGLSDLDVQPYF